MGPTAYDIFVARVNGKWRCCGDGRGLDKVVASFPPIEYSLDRLEVGMENHLTQEEKVQLLKLARDTMEKYLSDGGLADLPKMTGYLSEICGAFVTLHKHGELRGCIGNMIGHGPLAETVREMAVAASTQDPRFPKVDVDELAEIDIEISALTPMHRIKDVSEIEVGKHGILMRRGMYQGVLLPQVATEYGWDRDTFLAHTCMKAGLPTSAWSDPETVIEIFSADVFGEKELTV
jgi:AmmeMemoRadiSam system protein A